MSAKRVGLAILCGFAVLSQFKGAGAQSYDEAYRPQVHFSPRQNWTNDPNGLVYFEGEYHLFFQYNPFGDKWGHMSWGHAVSPDLVHWHELPVAIPEEGGVMIFTGSVVVDRDNTSQLCPPGTICLVAIYTGDSDTPEGHRQTQNIAYSKDKGRTWTKYKLNPVLDLHLADFRDPSVFRDESTHHWIMTVSLPKEHKVRFYSSPDLKNWSLLSEFGPAGNTDGAWECPDLLRIPSVNGKESIWALKVGINPGAPQGGSGEQYFLGAFDGTRFKLSDEPGAHGWTNYGKDDYCAISFNGLPKGQPPLLLGWMNNWQYADKLPTSPWRGQMSLARRLTLVHDDSGLALGQQPVVDPARGKSFKISGAHSGHSIDSKNQSSIKTPFELNLQFGHPHESIFGVRIHSDASHWTEIGFEVNQRVFYIDRRHSGAEVGANFLQRTEAPLMTGRPYDLRIIVDRSSVEAYTQNGTIAMTDLIFPVTDSSTIEIFPKELRHKGISEHVWQLNSIWTRPSSAK